MARRVAILVPIALWAAVGAVRPAHASEDSFSCGDRLVTRWLHEGTVLDRCGAPAHARHDHVVTYDENGQRIELGIDIWLYDFGPTRFTYVLRFEDDVLTQIDRGDYGH